MPIEYTEEELASFFAVTTDRERELFSTFLLTGFREQEVVFLFWSDINLKLRTIRVTSKPHLGFSPKRWEEREIPIPVELARLLEERPHLHSERFVFPSPTGNREHNMLLKCKAIAERAGLDTEKFDLKTFRSTYATRMLRSGFDVRTVQHWMGHKSLETTMRYLVPASDVHDRLDQVVVPSIAKNAEPPRKSVQQEVAAGQKPPPAPLLIPPALELYRARGFNLKNVLGPICLFDPKRPPVGYEDHLAPKAAHANGISLTLAGDQIRTGDVQLGNMDHVLLSMT